MGRAVRERAEQAGIGGGRRGIERKTVLHEVLREVCADYSLAIGERRVRDPEERSEIIQVPLRDRVAVAAALKRQDGVGGAVNVTRLEQIRDRADL